VLDKLYAQYRDRVAFFVVYITEAHPSDIWQMPSNVRDGVLFDNPTTFNERVQVAGSCVRKLHIPFPALIDGIENRVEQVYTGWPDRLYLIGTDGRILFKTEPGPFGFSSTGLAAALSTLH
jgi:type I thyroxine 5'-deiodinase